VTIDGRGPRPRSAWPRADVLSPRPAEKPSFSRCCGSFGVVSRELRAVEDLTAHLLQGSIRRVSAMRDAYRPPTAGSFSTAEDLTQFIQEDNRRFMNGMSRVSPQIICEERRALPYSVTGRTEGGNYARHRWPPIDRLTLQANTWAGSLSKHAAARSRNSPLLQCPLRPARGSLYEDTWTPSALRTMRSVRCLGS